MKSKLALFLLLLTCHLITKAQFAPVGTVWNYVDWHPWLWPESHNVKISIEKDTLIQGKIYSKFDEKCFKTIDSGRVYYYANNNHHLLFDYNAQQGDTISVECHTLHPDTIYPLSIKIDSVYYIKDLQLNNIKAYLIHSITPIEPWIENTSIVYEKLLIGENTADYTVKSEDLFPIMLEARAMHFYCYREPVGFSFLLTDSGNCDLVDVNEIENLQNQVSVYPNPTNQILNIQNETQYDISAIEIYDVAGLKLSSNLKIQNNSIETTSLPSGNYWLIIEFTNHSRVLKKIVVSSK